MTPRHVNRRSVGALLAAGLLVASCSSDDDAGPDTTTAQDTTAPDTTDEEPPSTELDGEGLELGVLTPAPGLISTLFQAQVRGIDFAAADIADAGGVLDGPLNATSSETPLGAPPVDAVAPALDAGAEVLVGPASSTGAEEVRDAVQEAGAVTCSASASVPGLTYDQETFGLFRTALPDDVVVSFVADTIIERRDADAPDAAWNVAIVARSDDYGLTFGNTLAASLKSRGLNPSVVDYNPNRVLFVGTASEVTNLDPDITVIVSYEEGAPILTELTRAGVPAASVIGLDAFFQPRIATIAAPDGEAEAIDGFTMIGTVGDLGFLNRLYEDDANGQVANAAQAYDCAMLLALATEAVDQGAADSISDGVRDVSEGGNTCSTYDDCLAKLDAGEDIDYDGPSGDIAIDEFGDPTFGRFTTARLDGGEIVDIESVDVDVAEIRREQAAHASAVFTTSLQQALTILGFFSGPIDGLESPELTAALAAFQTSVGLPPTGVMDAATYDALVAALDQNSAVLTSTTSDIQRLLTSLGYYDGPIDGIWTQQLTDALKAWQADLGVPQTGILDEATVRAAYEQGVFGGGETPETTVPPTTAPPTTAPATVPPVTAPPTTAPPTTAPPETAPPTTDAPTDPTLETILDTLRADPDFSVFVELVEKSGLTADVNPTGIYTVFAPTNAALADAGVDVPALEEDLEVLQQAILYHIVEGEYLAEDLPTTLRNLYGACLVFDTASQPVTVDDAPIGPANILASNGVIHGLETVLDVPENPPVDCPSGV